MKRFPGVITSSVIEARFAFSGKVSWVGKKTGDPVKQWEAIANLDRKVLQAELDQELADYEQARAEFEIYKLKAGTDDVAKFLGQSMQAKLNTAVKKVELAKYHMDQATLYSPVNGTILDIQGLVPGIYVTPASNPVTLYDTDTLHLLFEVSQKDLPLFIHPQKMNVSVSDNEISYTAITHTPLWWKDGVFRIQAFLDKTSDLLPGMKGQAVFSEITTH